MSVRAFVHPPCLREQVWTRAHSQSRVSGFTFPYGSRIRRIITALVRSMGSRRLFSLYAILCITAEIPVADYIAYRTALCGVVYAFQCLGLKVYSVMLGTYLFLLGWDLMSVSACVFHDR